MGFTTYGYRAESESAIDNEVPLYFAGANKQAVSRVAPGVADSGLDVYADELIQEHTGGKIFRAGYRVGGVDTFMLDITSNGVTIRNGKFYFTGPMRYDVEAYALPADLNADGAFKINVSATYAFNAAAAAVRAGTIAGNAAGPYGWGQSRRLVLNSSVYTINSSINFTKLNDCIVETAGGGAALYCGNNWTNSGLWDSGVNGSGTAVAATNAPMIDATGCGNATFRRISPQACPMLGPITTAPTVKPGCGWLVSGTEIRSGGLWGVVSNSNNCTFEFCSALGWFGRSPWILQNTQILTFEECGAQQYENSANARALYLGQTPLASIDSPFYPNPSSPADGDERMGQTASAASDVMFRRCEFHDMTRSYSGTPDAQSSLTGTILLNRVYNVKFYGGPQSSSGLAHVELTGDCRGLLFEGVEFYDDGEGIPGHTTGTKPNYILYNRGLNSGTPAQDVVFRNCWWNTPLASGVFGGESGASFLRMTLGNNQPRGAPTLFVLLWGYSGAGDYALQGSSNIDCMGLAVQIGAAGLGGIGPGVHLRNPAGPTVAGTNNADMVLSAGDMVLPQGLTTGLGVSTGNGSVGVPAWRFTGDSDNGAYYISANKWGLAAGGVAKLIVASNVEVGTAALATNATAGFLGISTSAGPPTGNPSPTSGIAPVHYDSTNNKFYVYNGAWRSTPALT